MKCTQNRNVEEVAAGAYRLSLISLLSYIYMCWKFLFMLYYVTW